MNLNPKSIIQIWGFLGEYLWYTSYHNSRMTPTKAFYNSIPIAPPLNHLTTEQKLELLDWHPIFTGRCPNCERPIWETTPPRSHWDCAECGWGEELV